jgi:hypothetical protein
MEWRCTNCGHGVPKNNPPCDRCGNMRFAQAEVSEHDFDEEITAASTAEILRENAGLVCAVGAVLLVVVVATLVSTGVFVVSDPFGLRYRLGAVDAEDSTCRTCPDRPEAGYRDRRPRGRRGVRGR